MTKNRNHARVNLDAENRKGAKSANSNTNSFQVFPNPATDYCIVEFVAPISSSSSLTMFDITGKEIGHWQLNEGQDRQEISLKSVPVGFYVSAN